MNMHYFYGEKIKCFTVSITWSTFPTVEPKMMKQARTNRLWEWPRSGAHGWAALFGAGLCFQVSTIKTERWRAGNQTKCLCWSKLTWLGFHGSCGAWEPLSIILCKDSPQQRGPHSPAKPMPNYHIQVQNLLASFFSHQHSGSLSTSLLCPWQHAHAQLRALSRNVALSYWEHNNLSNVCLPAWVSLAFCNSQERPALLLRQGCMTPADTLTVWWKLLNWGSQETWILALTYKSSVWP